MEVVRRFLDTEGTTEYEVMAAIETAPLKKITVADGDYIELNQIGALAHAITAGRAGGHALGGRALHRDGRRAA